MDELKRQIAIIYIEPKQMFFYGGSPPVLLQLSFPKEIVNDQEILSKEKFFQLFQTFFQQHSIVPANVILIVSSLLTYEKEYPEIPSPKNENLQNFLDIVPFEEVLSKVYKLNKKIKIVATNKQFCDELIRSLKQLQSKAIAIVPLSVVQEIISGISQNLDLGIILSKADALRQYSIIPLVEEIHTVLPEKKSDRKRFYLLVGVFAILVLILIVMILTSGIIQPKHIHP